jgi:hypothetical protein
MCSEYKVRVRVSAPDPYAGLQGHEYIKARGLSPQTAMEGTRQMRRKEDQLPIVLNILEGWDL